jgi:hypothetical protein
MTIEQTQETENLVYVRQLDADEIEQLIAPEALSEVDNPDELFAVWSDEGKPLAIVQTRDAAFEMARANSLHPVSVH